MHNTNTNTNTNNGVAVRQEWTCEEDGSDCYLSFVHCSAAQAILRRRRLVGTKEERRGGMGRWLFFFVGVLSSSVCWCVCVSLSLSLLFVLFINFFHFFFSTSTFSYVIC